MPIVLKHNLATELGLVNGAKGILTEIKLDPREPSIPTWQFGDTEPPIHKLRYQPLCLLVRFPDCKLTEPLEPALSSDPKVVPIKVMKKLFWWKLKAKASDALSPK